MKQEILIIGFDEERCKMLQDALQSNLINAHCALSVEDAVRHLIRYEYHLVIVNAATPFPDLEGALESIRKIRPVPILVLTPAISSDKLVKLLSLADDILREPYDMDIFRAKVQATLRRLTYDVQQYTPSVLSKDDTLFIDTRRRKVCVLQIEIALPRKQYELLYFLASHEGQVFTHEQLYRAIWGDDPVLSPSSPLSCQMRKLRGKLESVPGAPPYIQTIKGVGYRFDTNKQ